MAMQLPPKFSIDPSEVLNRATFGPGLTRLIRDSDAIVAPKDISGMVARAPKDSQGRLEHGELKHNNMLMAELVDLIRDVTDMSGSKVYAEAQIKTGKVAQKNLYNYQTFVDLQKIGNLMTAPTFYSYFDFAGLKSIEACVLTYDDGDSKYTALYVPPIVEYMPKANVEVPLENLRRRAEKEDYAELPAFNGGGSRIALKPVISAFEAILRNRNILVLPILRDGTHRAYITNTAGTSMHAIIINGSIAMAPSVPRETEEIILTNGKPERRTDRFLGLDESGWVDLKGVGIDA